MVKSTRLSLYKPSSMGSPIMDFNKCKAHLCKGAQVGLRGLPLRGLIEKGGVTYMRTRKWNTHTPLIMAFEWAHAQTP